MNERVKVSVVVPVYNSYKYLNRCVESLLMQDFDSYEIILVDDGSTDDSGILCDEYQNAKEIIFAFHKINGGMSDARNCGIEKANGEYVTFVDSDDTIISTYISDLYHLVQKYNADMSLGGFNIVDNDVIVNSPTQTFRDYAITGKEAFRCLLRGGDVSSSACALMIKREVAMKYKFPIGKYHEDDLTSYKYFLASDLVAVTNKRLYNYYQNAGSVMHTVNQQILDLLYATENYFTVAKDLGEEYVLAANCRKFVVFLQILRNYPDMQEIYPNEYRQVKDYINKIKWAILWKRGYPMYLKKSAIKCIFNKI